ncbi:phosphohistidine phosphatase SixA [Bdellovibrionota bacterium]
MEILLVRHAEAESSEVNPNRPLSKIGVGNIRKVATFIKSKVWDCQKILHSDKLRAEQTAKHLAGIAFPDAKIELSTGLSPNDSISRVAEQLEKESENLILVGHLPFMDKLVGLLSEGDELETPFSFPPAGVVCLEFDGVGYWKIKWTVTPDTINRD